MLHSANWDDKVALTKNTSVAIIGNGSSASEYKRLLLASYEC